MQLDIVDLREFYARPLGSVVRRILVHRMRARWRKVDGMNVFGLGYAAPFLGAFREDAARVGALMPAAQGVAAWPDEGPKQVALVDQDMLPLPDSCADRMLLVHCLENSENTRGLLREIWRVLAPGGRLLLVVPNRRGVWARLDTTPFGTGRPYSRAQLAQLLRDSLFTPLEWMHALHMPPLNWPLLVRWALVWERIGAVLWPGFSGVILVEATKQIYAMTPEREAKAARAPLRPVPAGSASTRSGAPISATTETPPARQQGSEETAAPHSRYADRGR